MKELEDYIKKQLEKEYFELFLIICEIAKNENIISFTYKDKYFTVQVSDRDYYRIKIGGGEN